MACKDTAPVVVLFFFSFFLLKKRVSLTRLKCCVNCVVLFVVIGDELVRHVLNLCLVDLVGVVAYHIYHLKPRQAVAVSREFKLRLSKVRPCGNETLILLFTLFSKFYFFKDALLRVCFCILFALD